MSTIHVAVAVIINEDDQVLIAKRSADQYQGNKWEFPGGKVEDAENSQEALCREIQEELGIQIQSAELITDIIHQYTDIKNGDKIVFLDVYEIKSWLGEATSLENQPLRWVNKSDLNQYDFPKANAEILSLLTR